MEASELRIGNWVLKSLLDGSMKGEYQIKGYDLKDFDKATYEPLLIAEQRLKDFGFSNEEKWGMIDWWWIDDFFISWDGGNENWVWMVMDEGGVEDTKLQCVYQLQNLYFALKNKELIKK